MSEVVGGPESQDHATPPGPRTSPPPRHKELPTWPFWLMVALIVLGPCLWCTVGWRLKQSILLWRIEHRQEIAVTAPGCTPVSRYRYYNNGAFDYGPGSVTAVCIPTTTERELGDWYVAAFHSRGWSDGAQGCPFYSNFKWHQGEDLIACVEFFPHATAAYPSNDGSTPRQVSLSIGDRRARWP
jgi:hypothetical protein